METPKEKVIELINKELEENYEILNNENNYYHDDFQAVKIQTNFLTEMLLEVEKIPDSEMQLQKDKEELLEMLKFALNRLKNTTEYEVVDFYQDDCDKIESLIQKHKQ